MGGFTPTIIPHVVYAMHGSRQQDKKFPGEVVDTKVLELYYLSYTNNVITGVIEMITKQQRETIGQLIEAKATALAVLNQSGFASEFKAHAAFDYVRASDELDAYLDSLVSEEGTTAADSDGWIHWSGGKRPVNSTELIEIMFRNGEIHLSPTIHHYEWRHLDRWSDIIAYRIVGPRTNTN